MNVADGAREGATQRDDGWKGEVDVNECWQ